jgi:hypothetical protein
MLPDSSNLELGTRLRRVENLLQRLTDVDSSAAGTLLDETSVDGSVTAPIEADSHPPLLSLFDNAVVSLCLRGLRRAADCLVWPARRP